MSDIIRVPIDKGWMPDIPAFELPDGGLKDCKDCYPLDYEYVGIPGEVTASATAPANVVDAVYDYEYQNITIGAAKGLYRYANGATAFTQVDRSASYIASPVNRWQFAFYGEWLLATCGTVPYPVQVLKGRQFLVQPDSLTRGSLTATMTLSVVHEYTAGDKFAISGSDIDAYNGVQTVVASDPALGKVTFVPAYTATGNANVSGIRTSPCFKDLGGSPPYANFMLLVKDHLLLANCITGSATQTTMPLRLYYSAEGNIENWTPSITTGCGYQDFPDGGYQITGLESLTEDTFAVFFDRSVYLGRYSGYPWYFTFQKIVPDGIGAFPYSTVVANGGIYFISTDYDISFLSTGGIQKLNVAFRETLRIASLAKNAVSDVQVIHDEENNLIIWYINKVSSPTFNKLIIFNYKTGQFSYRDKEIEALTRYYATVLGIGTFVRNGFLKSGKLITYSSTTRDTLTLETKEITHPKNDMLNLTRIRPHCNHDTTTKTVSIGNRKIESASATYSTAVNVDADGYANTRVAGRNLSIKLTCQRIGRGKGIDMEVLDGGKQ